MTLRADLMDRLDVAVGEVGGHLTEPLLLLQRALRHLLSLDLHGQTCGAGAVGRMVRHGTTIIRSHSQQTDGRNQYHHVTLTVVRKRRTNHRSAHDT